MIDFSVEPDFQAKLDWMREFVKRECEPLDLLFPHHGDPYDTANATSRAIVRPLQDEVRRQGLWACHLDSKLGGQGYGQVKLALMNQILGRSDWAPTIFGCAAPDTGNAEILALYGTVEQKRQFLQPLLDGEIVSCFAMTEPQAGADPTQFVCKARREGAEWIIDGEKWFATNARYAAFLIVMAVTDPTSSPHERTSMFIVPSRTAGIDIVRNVGVIGDDPAGDAGAHAYIRFNAVRLPLDAMLGCQGEGFKVAQARLGGGRIHHAMRTVGQCERAIEMMRDRAVTRRAGGKTLAEHQFVQGMIADNAIALEQFRLLVLKTAWIIDTQSHSAARTHIAMCKAQMPRVYEDVVQRAIQVHGSYGASNETPLAKMWMSVPSMGLADGPTEVHKVQVAKSILKGAQVYEGIFPSEHNPSRLVRARERLGPSLDASVAR